jgi:hypothetical protein
MKHLLLAFTLLLTACNDGLGEDTETQDPIERSDAMPLASGPYEDMLNREAGMVAAVPPPPGIQAPWSGSLNLGNEVMVQPDSENHQTILKLDEWGPPEMWTLSLGLTVTDGNYAAATAPIIARVNFGAGGSTQEVRFNWINGARISLPMNAVSVVAEYGDLIDPLTAMPITPPTNVSLSAQLARGASTSNCRLFDVVDTVNTGIGGFIAMGPIPAFAKSFYIDTTLEANVAYVNRTPNTVETASRSIAIADVFRKEYELFDHTRELWFRDSFATEAVSMLVVYRIGM